MSENRQRFVADTLTHISLCAGIGGLDLGIKRVFPSVRTIAYVEREISACEILGSQMEKGNLDLAPIWTDVKTFPADSFRGKVDIVSGGYPCQPFSVAGQRRGTEDPRHLWPYIARIVDVIRPRICVFENVRGHVRLGLSDVLADLRGLGYRVRAGIFAASEVGAPHRRERVFILGYLPGSGLFPSAQLGIYRREKSARPRNGESERSGAMEHSARITEREPHNEAASESRQDARTMSGGRRAALAYSIREGLQGHAGNGDGSHEPGRVCSIENGSACTGGVLENTVSERRRGGGIRHGESPTARDETEAQTEGPCPGWPARPGEPQHEWEEPRTIDRKLNPSWVAQLMGLPSDWVEVEGLTREMKLRALGNGVVQQQAEYAIRCLTGQWSL